MINRVRTILLLLLPYDQMEINYPTVKIFKHYEINEMIIHQFIRSNNERFFFFFCRF